MTIQELMCCDMSSSINQQDWTPSCPIKCLPASLTLPRVATPGAVRHYEQRHAEGASHLSAHPSTVSDSIWYLAESGQVCRGVLAAAADSLGRVMLVDVAAASVIRMFKGYRDAHCCWLLLPPSRPRDPALERSSAATPRSPAPGVNWLSADFNVHHRNSLQLYHSSTVYASWVPSFIGAVDLHNM